MKYKIGDRVRINKNYPDYAFQGITGTITDVSETSTYPYSVKLDESVKNFQLEFAFLQHVNENELDLIHD